MKLAIIVATDEQGLIGKENDLPWRLPADLQYFKKITMNKPIIMGRGTHESIGRPLPGRKNIVLTRCADYKAPGCELVHSLDEALTLCHEHDEVMIVGGSSLYQQTLAIADKLYLTLVHITLQGDTWFPDWSINDWKLVSREDFQADEKNNYDYSFILYERIRK